MCRAVACQGGGGGQGGHGSRAHFKSRDEFQRSMLWAPRSLCISRGLSFLFLAEDFFFFFFFVVVACLSIFFQGGYANSGGGGADASIGPRALETLGTPLVSWENLSFFNGDLYPLNGVIIH